MHFPILCAAVQFLYFRILSFVFSTEFSRRHFSLLWNVTYIQHPLLTSTHIEGLVRISSGTCHHSLGDRESPKFLIIQKSTKMLKSVLPWQLQSRRQTAVSSTGLILIMLVLFYYLYVPDSIAISLLSNQKLVHGIPFNPPYASVKSTTHQHVPHLPNQRYAQNSPAQHHPPLTTQQK